MGSIVHELAVRGRLFLISGKLHGIRVVGVRGVSGSGTKKMVEVLFARAHGKRLPLEEDTVAPGKHAIGHTAFSKWNEPVTVKAPASSTPIAAVRAS